MSMKTILDALPPPGKPKSVIELAGQTGLSRHAVAKFCGKLLEHQFVDRPERGVYRLTKNGLEARNAGHKFTSGPNGKHTGRRKAVKGTSNARVWHCLRNATGAITVPEIQSMTGLEQVNTIHRFLHHLESAGYVTKLGRRVQGTKLTSPGFAQYLLLNNSGPEAPRFNKGEVYDPNTDETRQLAGAS